MLLMHLLFHAANNQYMGTLRAIQLYDIHIITKSFKDKNWTQLQKIVEDMGCEKLVYIPLVLAAGCFEISVPDSVMNKLHLKTPKGLKSLMNNYSLQQFIASNESQTLIYLSQNIKSSFYKKALLLTSILLSKSFISSIQLEWCGSRKKRLREAMNLLVPPAARIDNLGYFIGSLVTFMIFFLTIITKHLWLHRLREKLLNRFKLLIFRHEAKYENIKINIVDDNEK